MGIGRPGEGAGDGAQVEAQHPLVFDLGQIIGPETAVLGVGLDQGNLCILATREAQVGEGLLVDGEHRGRGAVLRRHVGNGSAIPEAEGPRTLAINLEVGPHHPLLAEEFREGQDQVRPRDPWRQAPGQLHAHHIRGAHHGGPAEHHGLRLKAADAHGNDAEGVHHGGVAVRPHAGVGEGHAVPGLHHGGHFLEVDLVHDAVPRGDDVDVIEGVLAPVDEVEAVGVASLFHRAILLEGPFLKARVLHGEGVVDDELRGHHGIHRGRISAALGDGVPKPRQIHQRRLPQNVVAHHPRRIPGEVEITLPLDQLQEAGVERFRIAPAYQLLREHPGRVGQGGVGAGL